MLTIDGSRGEGGGQILRTGLALSIITGTPFRIHSIRAGRDKPGLLRQHLAAVNAAAAVGCAQVRGAALGSTEVTFIPSGLAPGNHRFAVGSAGSATLVLQTVLPALLRADAPSTLILEGGTHNPAAPPFEFLERAFVPLVNRTGANVAVELERPGFFPAGGGRFIARITPAAAVAPVHIRERGEVIRRRATALVSSLPGHIGERELETVRRQMSWPADSLHVRFVEEPRGPGNAVILELVCEGITEVFTSFGAYNVSAEAVACRAVEEARRYIAAVGVPVGEHLADQLVLLLAVGAGGSFATLPPTQHTRTNIETIRLFLDRPIETREERKDRVLVTVG